MSPKGGTIPIRVSIHKLRIRAASGTHNKDVAARMVARLKEAGQYDHLVPLIRDVAIGKLTPMEFMQVTEGKVFAKWRPRSLVPLVRAINLYVTGLDKSAKHRQEVGYALHALAKTGSKRATADDVPELLEAERERRRVAKQAPAFNHLRNYCRGFLRNRLGSDSEAYQRVKDMAPLAVTERREGHPCTVEEAVQITTMLGEHFGPVWFAMCLTGAMPDEVWGGKVYRDSESGHLHVRGTKRKARNRLVPLVFNADLIVERPVFSVWMMRQRLKAASGGRVQLYDARRTAARWWALAGVPYPHQQAYLGHSKSMTGLYQAGNERPYLDTDAALVSAFLEASVKKSAGVESVSPLPLKGSNLDSPDPESGPASSTDANKHNPARLIASGAKESTIACQESCGGQS